MKPKEITFTEYEELTSALTRKSMQLAQNTRMNIFFFSSALLPCVYANRRRPSNYRALWEKGAASLWHFLPYDCNCGKAEMGANPDPTEWPVCLAVVEGDGVQKYFLSVHPIGKCPFKKVP